MKNKLFQLLSVEHNDKSLILGLLTQSVLLGVFFGTFDISAHSMFLSIFDEKVMARAYVISGLAGIILTGSYFWIKSKILFRNFAILNFIFISILTFILWLFLLFNPTDELIFIVFVMMGPLNILSILSFFGTTGLLNKPGNDGNLSDMADAGVIFGVIIAGFLVPVLLSFNLSVFNFILISSVSMLATCFFQVSIGKHNLQSEKIIVQNEIPDMNKAWVSILMKSSYLRTIVFFTGLSVITAFFVQYSFMAVTRAQFPAEQDMARFLGFFTGILMLVAILIRLFIYPFLTRQYGLKISLAISALVIGLFTLLASCSGIIFGFTPASGGFTLFLILITISSLFSRSLKESIVAPSFRLLYFATDKKESNEIQLAVIGPIYEIAVLISGLLLSGLGLLTFIKLIHFSWVLMFLLIGLVFLAIHLYSEYKNSIKSALQSGLPDYKPVGKQLQVNPEGRFFLGWILRSDYYNIISQNNIGPNRRINRWYDDFVIDYAIKNQDINLLPFLKRIIGDTNGSEAIRHKAADAVFRLEELLETSHKNIATGIKLTGEQKVLHARKILFSNRLPQTTELLRLLRDNSVESKRFAILAIGKLKIADMLPEVCQCLNVKDLEIDAMNVLNSFSRLSEEELSRYYLSSTGNIKTGLLIIRLLGNSCSDRSNVFLNSRLFSTSRKIKEAALLALVNCGYKAKGEEQEKLHRLTSEIIGLLAWNLAVRVCLKKNNDEKLLMAIEQEISAWNSFLFNLLSIMYDPGPISRIKEHIESGMLEGFSFANEMIDILIDNSLKDKLKLLIAGNFDEKRLCSLNQFYPDGITDYCQLIDDVLNRDYNSIGIWAKAGALNSLKNLPGKYDPDSIIALLFSQELILREEAARLLMVSGKDLYQSVSGRLAGPNALYINRIMTGQMNDGEYLFEKVNFLLSCFPEIPGEDLITLAEDLKFTNNLSLADTSILEDNLVFINKGPIASDEVYVISGTPDTNIEEKLRRSGGMSFYLLHEKSIEDYLLLNPGYSSIIFKYVDAHEIN